MNTITSDISETSPISVLLKCNSEILNCRVVVGIAKEFVSPNAIVNLGVTLYSIEKKSDYLIDSFVIELKAGKVADKLSEGTLLAYIEEATLAKEEYIAKAAIGEGKCRH